MESSDQKVWVKYGTGHAVKVSVSPECDVSDLIEAIKGKLSPDLDEFSLGRISLHGPEEGRKEGGEHKDSDFEPDVLVSNILETKVGTCARNPILIRTTAQVPAEIATAGSIEILEEMKDTLQHLVQAKNRRRDTVRASSISSRNVDTFFRCGELPWDSVLKSRISYGNADTTKVIVDAVVALSTHMQQIRHSKWKNCEIELVQPYVHTSFLPAILGCLENADYVELEREREFQLSAMNGEDDELPVKGSTDHCLKITRGDCRVFTVEDKAVCKELSKSNIAQAMSQMMAELRDMLEFYSYRPQRYCGILHNCSEWLFIERQVLGNSMNWSYVKLLPIFTSPDSGINMDNCRFVAAYLEHVLKVADSITADVRNYRFVSTALPLISISEHDSDVDDGDDDVDDDVDEYCSPEEAKPEVKRGGNKIGKPDRTTKRGAGLTKGRHHNVLTMRARNACNVAAGKENAFMPLTSASLRVMPTNFFKKF